MGKSKGDISRCSVLVNKTKHNGLKINETNTKFLKVSKNPDNIKL